jgi:hypothetical protein
MPLSRSARGAIEMKQEARQQRPRSRRPQPVRVPDASADVASPTETAGAAISAWLSFAHSDRHQRGSWVARFFRQTEELLYGPRAPCTPPNPYSRRGCGLCPIREAVAQFIADISDGGQSFHPRLRAGEAHVIWRRWHALGIPSAIAVIGDSSGATARCPARCGRRRPSARRFDSRSAGSIRERPANGLFLCISEGVPAL